jgi:hypothetical protein
MHPAVRAAEREFRHVLSSYGRDAPLGRDISARRDDYNLCVEFELSLTNDRHHRWCVDERELLGEASPIENGRIAYDLVRELQSLFSRCYEDHLMVVALAALSDEIMQIAMVTGDPEIVHRATRQYHERAEHIRRHHAARRAPQALVANESVFSIGDLDRMRREYARPDGIVEIARAPARGNEEPIDNYGCRFWIDWVRNAVRISDSIMPGAIQPVALPQTATEIRMRYAQERFNASRPSVNNGLYAFRQEVMGDFIRANLFSPYMDFDVGGDESQKKGEKLLKEWLSAEQLKQYDDKRYFEVVGSDTGKRYRISHGRQMNIYELDRKGEPKNGWCFLPEGGLVAGDVMLAQKIALENFEKKALAKANRF